MAKVLFVCNNLTYGGIPRALVNLLKELAPAEDVSLLLFEPSGEYMDEIPEGVKLLPTGGKLPYLGIAQRDLKKRSKGQALQRAFYVAVSRVFDNSWARGRVFRTVKDYGPFDAAVSYAQDNNEKSFAIGCNDFVLRKVKAKKKIACVHCDFEHYGGNTEKNRRPYYDFDRIVCVSDGCRAAFVRQCPELAERTLSIGNCTDYGGILRLAQESVQKPALPEGSFVMVTVARIYPEKGIPRAIEAVTPVMKEHPELVWLIVGDGIEMEACKKQAEEAGLADRILFAGRKANPYPWIKGADLFFLPSHHEAAPMVFEEARALSVPVLTTETTSSRQMVEERGIGFVCENSREGITAALEKCIKDRGRLEEIRDGLSKMALDNSEIRRRWTELLEVDA
ncbi:MAG: glycosyltransferase [Lachnospiraceae bacterium]|nr:glycosyltransferase [Lachnospiraceae bacterium]